MRFPILIRVNHQKSVRNEDPIRNQQIRGYLTGEKANQVSVRTFRHVTRDDAKSKSSSRSEENLVANVRFRRPIARLVSGDFMKKNNYRLPAGSLVALLACVTAASVALAQEREPRSVILRDGAKLSSAQGIQSGQPLALAAADFDEDGVPDLIASYAGAQGALVVMRRGNVDAIYPNSPEAKVRKQNGQFTEAAFLSEARSSALTRSSGLDRRG